MGDLLGFMKPYSPPSVPLAVLGIKLKLYPTLIRHDEEPPIAMLQKEDRSW